MNSISRFVAVVVITVVVVSATNAHAAPRSRPLDEEDALAFLEHTLKRDRVYSHRISLDCVTYSTEETTHAYFQFVLRENHGAKCGGDPDVSPVVDRYRVYRRSRKIEWLEKIGDNWVPYNPEEIR